MSTRLRPLLASAGPIFAGTAERALEPGDDGPEITGVTHDSRRVGAGTLFCCLRGATSDGHRHAGDAVRSGAVALLCERPVGADVPQVRVADARRAMAPLAAAFHGHPSHAMRVVGVTGTNGKTTTVRLVQQIVESHGANAATIGTLTGARTTPEATELQQQLAEHRENGVDTVAMEVSSHALVQHRVDATRFAAVAFTNLSRDHLDFHGTMEAYFAAKASLFTRVFAPVAVIDTDTPYGRLLASTTDVPTVVRTGLSTVDIVSLGADATRYRWRGHDVLLPLPGRFNVANALVASELALVLGVPEAAVVSALSSAPPVPGRFQRVPLDAPFTVVVDYAHTPDGLENVLSAARELAGGARVLVAFGCGGDRDATKRPFMGRAAREGADVVVVTSDNPRSENPSRIVEEVVGGMAQQPDAVELDRRAAIRLVLAAARPGDIVVLAGKGHETTQIIGTRVLPFDDVLVAVEEAEALGREAQG
jgi:UDP-N-acetylmuramoyl-L-alanyl-D-glutamate--2,6-diaminopimelate ligase